MNKVLFQNEGRNGCDALAYEIFLQDAGLNRKGKKFECMKEDALRTRSVIEDRIDLRAAYVHYDKIALAGDTVNIDGVSLKCRGLSQIAPESVKGAYIYALSAGDFSCAESSVMEQLYADLWGSAFTEAVRILLKDRMEREAKLSDSFGPGYYGMDVREMNKLARLIDLRELGIEARENGILLPLKSCAGFYLSVTEDYVPLNQECINCHGNQTSCNLCHVHR
ncbi:MAG: hypothetical protein Q4C25_02630 [Bacillota bacterium]|nr:hypothetical protein [Bacillota bacterium]